MFTLLDAGTSLATVDVDATKLRRYAELYSDPTKAEVAEEHLCVALDAAALKKALPELWKDPDFQTLMDAAFEVQRPRLAAYLRRKLVALALGDQQPTHKKQLDYIREVMHQLGIESIPTHSKKQGGGDMANLAWEAIAHKMAEGDIRVTIERKPEAIEIEADEAVEVTGTQGDCGAQRSSAIPARSMEPS
jgi:hypothetical protein